MTRSLSSFFWNKKNVGRKNSLSMIRNFEVAFFSDFSTYLPIDVVPQNDELAQLFLLKKKFFSKNFLEIFFTNHPSYICYMCIYVYIWLCKKNVYSDCVRTAFGLISTDVRLRSDCAQTAFRLRSDCVRHLYIYYILYIVYIYSIYFFANHSSNILLYVYICIYMTIYM